MPITPLDIRKKTFGKSRFKGIDEKEVRAFLEQLAKDMEAIWKERALLAEKVEELNARLEGFSRTEKAFQEAFLTAQQTCNEMRNNAKHEAATLIERAKLDGEKLIRQAEEQAARLGQDISEIRVKKLAILGELRGLVQSFGQLIDHWESQDKAKPKQ
jgi:cell division initiation protein